jgi:hypothetical protein
MPSTPPNVANYFIGRGNVYTAAVDSTSWAHIGNCPKFSVAPSMDILQHFSSTAAGGRVLDDSQLNTKSCKLTINCDELHAESLMLALGATDMGSGLYRMKSDIIYRAVKLEGTNSKGPKVQVILPKVLFRTESDIDFIGEAYMSLPLVGDVLFYPKTFGGSDYTFLDVTFI